MLFRSVAGCLQLLERPSLDSEQLTQWVPAPDFPTEAEIISPAAELQALYASGRGSVRARAVWHREDGDIVVTALPFQVSGARVLEHHGVEISAAHLEAQPIPLCIRTERLKPPGAVPFDPDTLVPGTRDGFESPGEAQLAQQRLDSGMQGVAGPIATGAQPLAKDHAQPTHRTGDRTDERSQQHEHQHDGDGLGRVFLSLNRRGE